MHACTMYVCMYGCVLNRRFTVITNYDVIGGGKVRNLIHARNFSPTKVESPQESNFCRNKNCLSESIPVRAKVDFDPKFPPMMS